MRKITCLICCCLVFFLVSGFEAGVEVENLKNTVDEPFGPVLEYKETNSPPKSSRELYDEYHLLVSTSLEEASLALFEQESWACRMVENAKAYINLLSNLVEGEKAEDFLSMGNDISIVINNLKGKNLNNSQKKRLSAELNALALEFDNNFNLKEMQEWIKN